MRRIAVSLISGGLDSCVATAWAATQDYELYLLSINYGQVMQRELRHAQEIANYFKPTEYRLVNMEGFRELIWSCRTHEQLIEYDRPFDPGANFAQSCQMSSAYPPGRDPTFIFVAAAWAESLMLMSGGEVSSGTVIMGTNKNDAGMFPDCRRAAYQAINETLKVTTKVSLQYHLPLVVETPLIDLTKADVVRLGRRLQAPLEMTWSCYEGGERACGRCEPCKLRTWAFQEAGEVDAVPYATK